MARGAGGDGMGATPQATNATDLLEAVLAGTHGPPPEDVRATSASWICQTTRFPGTRQTYLNHYLLLRVGRSFGACAFEAGQLDARFCAEAAGRSLGALLRDPRMPVRIAALDGYLAESRPHRVAPDAEPVELPSGPPVVRARARDDAIAGLLEIEPGQRVALIGVVNPLVGAIRDRGGVCLPCDFNLRETQWGDAVASDMAEVLETADVVVATGMTLGNGTFDLLLEHCRDRGVPLVVYAQTGSAIVPRFLGAGVTGVSAEPFPFSQFSSEETVIYRYRSSRVRDGAGGR